MPLDAVCLSALTEELKPLLEGGKIDKIQQPERDMLLFSFRNQGKNSKLLVSAGNGNARVHISESSFENPAEPPMFCMLLRKHLVGAHIISVSQPDLERMLIIELDSRNELDIHSKKQLVVEMIGKSSNVILVDSDGRIIDCMRRMDFAGDSERRLLPGMIYRLPPKQNKIRIVDANCETVAELLKTADTSVPLDKWLLANFSGLSPLICRELSESCNGDYSNASQAIAQFAELLDNKCFSPNMLVRDAKPFDFSFMPIRQYGSCVQAEGFDSFSDLLDAFYSRRDKAEQQRRRSSELMRSVKTARDRLQRKLAGQTEELRRSEGKEEVRKTAELVTANIYKIKKGDRVLKCQDYYDPLCPEIEIALNPLKTPQQNAAILYKEYNKLKGAEQHLTVLIKRGQEQLEYLNSVISEIEQAESERDLSDIRRELVATGYIRKQKNSKPEKLKAQQPHCFVSDDGFEILVGRNNVQNDELTFKTARRTDYWLHTQKVHGSHVIIRCDSVEPPEATIEQAASLAVYYSQAREGGKTAVDCTMVRFVKKPSGSLPGKAIYTDYRTIMASADEALVERLKKHRR